ncbi:MAG: hypothetical protein DIZ80_12140 [endosymbiont of Galathealinum brachiosum]|uniref:OmpA-like domain-containing protein n=1 Tax=endosymbiont of Galathealinum brachiosum TaxID=2200906 RepID=A0A370DDL9_9GAMM|nr:MAG: hypothetical protein DIZ80_12140 [endosymbiont of Galathealinum brachiosum]
MKISNKKIYPAVIALSVPLLILGGCAGDDRVKLTPDSTLAVNETFEQSDEIQIKQDEIDNLITELPAQEMNEVIETPEPVESAIELAIEEKSAIEVMTPKPEGGIISFAFDKSVIEAEYGELLWQHAQYLKENKNLVLNISGHTDSSGARIYNEKLSKDRADQVAKILMDFGVAEDRIKVIGNASDLPLAGAIHHREHRRVELDYQDQQMVSN